MTIQKSSKYQPYPRNVQKGGKDGLRKRVENAEQEAEFLGKEIEDIHEKNDKRQLSLADQLTAAEKLIDEANAAKRAAEEILEQANALNSEASEKLAKAESLSSTEVTEKDPNKVPEPSKTVACAADVPDGDKDALEKYARDVLGVELDKRKGFSALLDVCKQEEAKNA